MADIAALATGDDHIANDTYFTGINNAGDTANVWKINQDNNFELGIPWLLESQNSEADAGIIYRNIPLRNLNYGDSVGFRDRAGGFELWKAWGIVDGSDGLASVGLTVNGTLLADNVSGTNTGDQDLSTLRDSVGNNMDSIANHTVRYYAVLDSLARHTVDYYTLQDSVINNMDSIASHSTNYYSLRDSVINNMDSITNHTVRYYDILDSLIVHDGHYYSLRDSVVNNMDSIVNHTVRYYGILDSLIVHNDNYYTLRDTVIQNMADIAAIEAGENDIDNDTWFTGDNYAGDSGNAWQVTKDNTIDFGYPLLLKSQNSADNIVWKNLSLQGLNYGDSAKYVYRAGGFELAKLWGISDGNDGLASHGLDILGDLYIGGEITDDITITGASRYIYFDSQAFFGAAAGYGSFGASSGVSLNLGAFGATETGLLTLLDGATTLYYDNAAKVATTGTGISVTGGISTTSDGNSDAWKTGGSTKELQYNNAASFGGMTGWEFNGGNVEVDATKKLQFLNTSSQVLFELYSSGTNVSRLNSPSGIAFQIEDDGTRWLQITSSGIALNAGETINEFSSDGTLAGNSNTAAPTERATKTYIDAHIRDTIVSLNDAAIELLYTTPTVLVDAAGGGTTIDVISCVAYYTHISGTGYTGPAPGVGFVSVASAQVYFNTNILAGSASANLKLGDIGSPGDQYATDEDLVIHTLGSDPADGTGSLKIYLSYRILTI
jgi:hypothetical protein